MLDKLGRDEMFYRICDINLPIKEKKEDVLTDLRKINNPNFQDNEGLSYLHMACQSHSIEAVTILLERGANPNIMDIYHSVPIMMALGRLNKNNGEILEIMLENGLNLQQNVGNKTLKEWIEMFHNEELNEIIAQYCAK